MGENALLIDLICPPREQTENRSGAALRIISRVVAQIQRIGMLPLRIMGLNGGDFSRTDPSS